MNTIIIKVVEDQLGLLQTSAFTSPQHPRNKHDFQILELHTRSFSAGLRYILEVLHLALIWRTIQTYTVPHEAFFVKPPMTLTVWKKTFV